MFAPNAAIPKLKELTQAWGTEQDVHLYLRRCQIATPDQVVRRVWELVASHRNKIDRVVDFGAGDGRFATAGHYDRYIGYEIDVSRWEKRALPRRATLVSKCAFSVRETDADLCIGNPPFVRNQDLPRHWRKHAAREIKERVGVTVPGLANAWQYFVFLALASTNPDGLVALVLPYEWVSRPSARELRNHILDYGYSVFAYRLRDDTFEHLTTSSITLIDKATRKSKWRYFEETEAGKFISLNSASGGRGGSLRYLRGNPDKAVCVRRGLSPGTQEVLTLSERERQKHGLHVGRDVVRCVTSLRHVPQSLKTLGARGFRRLFEKQNVKCWLIRTDKEPSQRLRDYLDSIPLKHTRSATCRSRPDWWRFTLPDSPAVIVATGFRTARPKAVRNDIKASVVGSVSGVYGLSKRAATRVVQRLHVARLRRRIVAHSNGMRKLEVGQLGTFLRNTLRRAVKTGRV